MIPRTRALGRFELLDLNKMLFRDVVSPFYLKEIELKESFMSESLWVSLMCVMVISSLTCPYIVRELRNATSIILTIRFSALAFF